MFRSLTLAGLLMVSALSAAQDAEDRAIKLVTPSTCPIICAKDGDRDYSDNGIIDVLEKVVDELGYYLIIDFDNAARSRNKAAMGMADLTLGSPVELSKHSRLELIEHAVGDTPVVMVYNPKRPIDFSGFTGIQDLAKYKMVWNKSIEVSPPFQLVFDQMRKDGQMDMISPRDFSYNALKRIHNGHADIMLISEATYEDAYRRLRRNMPEVVLANVKIERMPGHDINLAISVKSHLSVEEKRRIIAAVKQFKAPTSKSGGAGAKGGQLALLVSMLQAGQDLPPQAQAKIRSIPAPMLDNLGKAQGLNSQQLAALKQYHVSLQ